MIVSDIILRVQYNGSTYDLNVDKQVPLRIDMSAVEVGRVGEFFGVGSQTFALAGTKENNRFFNHAYDVAQDDVPAMYNTLPCSVLLNGETMIVGSVTLLSVVAGDDGWVTYNVQVADKVIQFEEGLASKLIKDANWSGYTHTLSSGSVIDSWDDNLLNGSVYYPMVDYGRDQENSKSYTSAPIFAVTSSGAFDVSNATIASPSNPAKMNQFLPAIKVKDTLDVIFQQAGFNYTSSFTETDDFDNLYILNKPGKGLGVQLSGSSIATFSANQGNPQSIGTFGSDVLVQQNLETFDPSNSYSTSTMAYTCPVVGDYAFTGRIGVNLASIGNSGDKVAVEFRLLYDVGSGFNSVNVLNETFIILGNSSGTYELTLPWNGALAQGTRLALFVQFTKITSFTGSILLNNASSLFTATQAPASYNNATVDMALQWEPKTKSIDVLKGILEQFNLVMTPKEGDRHTIEIETFDDWMRAGEIVDWTNRYDTAKRIKVEHTVSKLQKELFLKNKDDVDRFSKITIDSDPNEQYGTLRILADNTVSQGTKKIGNYFAPVVLGGAVNYEISSTGSAVFEGSYDINLNTEFILPHLYKFENSKQESYTIKPRIGYKVSNSLNSGHSFYVGSSNTEITGSYATIANVSSLPVLPGYSNDLHYNNTYTTFTNVDFNLREGKNNFDNYWKDYIDSIYWEGSKKVTLDLFFEPYEYQTIRLNSRILIKGQAYRINQIKGFNVTHRDVVTVELIKLYPAYWQVESPLPCEGDIPYQFPNLELRTDDCTTLGPTPIIARTLEFYNVGDFVYTIEDGSSVCYRVVGTSTSAHTRTINDGVSPLADCLTCNNLPTPTPLPTATNTPGPSPTPVPTATPVPQNCRLMVIGANASGDAIQVIGTCCDGTPFIEQEEDFASVEVCVDPAEIPNFTITSSGTGFWYLAEPCAGGC